MIVLKTEREVSYMRDAGKIVGQTFLELKKAIAPGITTHELDHIADQYIRRAGAIPAFKGYGGFPANICTSINEQVVHGIPGSRQLKDGDVISLDVGTKLNRYYGDAAITIVERMQSNEPEMGKTGLEQEWLIRCAVHPAEKPASFSFQTIGRRRFEMHPLPANGA